MADYANANPPYGLAYEVRNGPNFAPYGLTLQSSDERIEFRAREGRPRLYSSPPFGDAGMFLRGYFIGCDFLVDPFDERHRGDVGDRIGVADQPAGRFQRILHPVQQLLHQFGPRRAAFFLGIGLARHPQPGFLTLLARDVLEHLGQFLVRTLRRHLLQVMPPVEDDEIVDQTVDVPDPVAHHRALIRRIRTQRRIGVAFVEVFADGAALMQRQAVVN